MPSRTHAALAALAFALATGSLPVLAQTTPPAQSDQDHKGHHPDGKAPGTQAAPPQPSPPSGGTSGMMGQGGQGGMMGGMMCGDMKQMMSMMKDMHAMMGAQAGMMEARTEADIARLKTDLKITDAQSSHWNRFADAWRKLSRSTDYAHQQTMTVDGPLPARLTRMESAMLAKLNSLKGLEEALQPLYAALSDEQKKIADGMRFGSARMM